MKEVRYMTTEEFQSEVLPLIKELKSFFRKKYFTTHFLMGGVLTYDEYIKSYVEYSMDRNTYQTLGEEYFTERAIDDLEKENIKKEVPQEVIDRRDEIFSTLQDIFESKIRDILQMTKDHKREIRYCLDRDIYTNEVKENKVNFSDVERACDSVGVKIPQRVYKLKEKQQSGQFDTTFVKANEKFIKTIVDFLSPYKETLSEKFTNSVNKSVEKFQSSGKTMRDYFRESSMMPYTSRLLDYGSGNKVSNYDEILSKMAKDYADQYVSTFVSRLENKLNKLNAQKGIPSIEFLDHNFYSSEFQCEFKLTYQDGYELTGYSKVIIAGGYIQILHQRYIFNFFQEGKKVNLKNL